MREPSPAFTTCVASWCGRVVNASWFNIASFVVIIVNAIVLGLETYEAMIVAVGDMFLAAEALCLTWFAAELAIRFGAHLSRPAGFFRDPWNLFDLAVVIAPLLPGVRENVTLLRLLRLARIVRTFRLFPSLRVVLAGLRRSLPGMGSFLLIAVLTMYGYAMVGWMVFGEAYPDKYGTVGRAMLTLFLLLSLDGITDTFQAGRVVTEWSIPYYISYIIMASYLLTNLLVGVVLKALEDAHQSEASRPAAAAGSATEQSPDEVPIGERLARLRAALDALERDLLREPGLAGEALRPGAESNPSLSVYPPRRQLPPPVSRGGRVLTRGSGRCRARRTVRFVRRTRSF